MGKIIVILLICTAVIGFYFAIKQDRIQNLAIKNGLFMLKSEASNRPPGSYTKSEINILFAQAFKNLHSEKCDPEANSLFLENLKLSLKDSKLDSTEMLRLLENVKDIAAK